MKLNWCVHVQNNMGGLVVASMVALEGIGDSGFQWGIGSEMRIV